MAEQRATTGWGVTVEGIPGVPELELTRFTPPTQQLANSTMTAWKQGKLVHKAGDRTVQDVGTFSVAGPVPRDNNGLQEWYKKCEEEGFENNEADIIVTVLEGDEPTTVWNFMGCHPNSLGYSALTAGDPSGYEFDLTCGCTSYTVEQ
jgi:hypothetical protein